MNTMHAHAATAMVTGGPLVAGEALAHGVSLEATARAISRTWVRRYGYREACELIDAMQREAQRAANG